MEVKNTDNLKKNIIKYARNLFELKKENGTIKNRIIRDIRTIFKQEDDYCKPITTGNFWITVISIQKVVVIETTSCQ